MKLLILTQKVDKDDPILGFFHDWILEFAKNCEKVIVICLGKGKYDLPENVKIYSLGKEEIGNCLPAEAGSAQAGKLEIKSTKHEVNSNFQSLDKLGTGFLIFNFYHKIKYILRFYNLIWKHRKDYDSVFVHMNPEYVVLGGLFWKLWRKRVGLWYVHKAVNLKLRIAEKLSDKLFTAAKESFRLRSKKIVIAGHGIKKCKMQNAKCKIKENLFKIVYVGRISPIKNQKLLAEAADILVNREKIRDIKFKFIGAPIFEEDKIYFNELTNLAAEKSISQYLEFAGTVPHEKIFEEYDNSDLSINLCPTGGLDKAVLESMARGCLVFAHNKAFENILPKEFILNTSDKNELAEKIKWAVNLKEDYRNEIRKKMIKEIEKNHNLDGLVKRILEVLCD